MRNRISIKTKDRYKKSIRDVVQGLSRKIQVYKQPIKNECPNCYFNKLDGKSTGQCKWTIIEAENLQIDYEIDHPGQVRYKWFKTGRCPICRGEGFLETKRKVWIDCLVTWNPKSNDITYSPAGFEGADVVQLKTDTKYLELFRNCSSIVVDGIECKINTPPISRGLGDQDLLIISAFTTLKQKSASGEIIKEYN